jgi:hypothetical protein
MVVRQMPSWAVLLFAAMACKSEGTAPTGTSSATAPSTSDCQALKQAVLGEAAKLAACKTDDDCKVHRISVCDFHELGCYAAHVNKAGDPAPLDQAVSAYAKTCSLSKCKCQMPDKSVCKTGRCSGE